MSGASMTSLLRPTTLPAPFVAPARLAPALARHVGVRALAADSHSGEIPRLAREVGVSRQTVYTLRTQVQERLDGLFEEETSSGPESVTIRVDRAQIERAIVGARCATHSSLRGIMALVPLFYGMDSPSFGFVQETLVKAETNALAWMDRLPVSSVKAAVLDEIFLHRDPILEVADLDSQAILALSPMPSRGAVNWGEVFSKLQKRGLLPHVFVSDNGTGINRSVKQHFPKAMHRKDGFHVQDRLGREASRLERRAYKRLAAAYSAQEKRDHPSKNADRRSLAQNAWRMMDAANTAIDEYDTFRNHLLTVTEAMEFVQLSPCELKDPNVSRKQLADVASRLKTSRDKRQASLGTYLENQIDGLIQYMDELNAALSALGTTPIERDAVAALAALWRINRLLDDARYTYSHKSLAQQALGSLERLVQVPDERLVALGESVMEAIAHRNRASSLIECVNSVLRPIITVRKHVSEGSMALFAVWWNLHPRTEGPLKGTCPYTLLTGRKVKDWLTEIGFPPGRYIH